MSKTYLMDIAAAILHNEKKDQDLRWAIQNEALSKAELAAAENPGNFELQCQVAQEEDKLQTLRRILLAEYQALQVETQKAFEEYR